MATNRISPLAPEAITDELRKLREQMPPYSQLTTQDGPPMRAAANVDPRFVIAAIFAAEASPYIQGALGRTPESLRQELDEAARWAAVENEMRTMLKSLVATNLARRHRLGLTALQTYSISRQLVRQPEHADLLPHVSEMKRLNKFGRTRKVKPAETPATAK